MAMTRRKVRKVTMTMRNTTITVVTTLGPRVVVYLVVDIVVVLQKIANVHLLVLQKIANVRMSNR